MAAAAAAGSGDGKNIVAAQKNWEQRVNTELEATKLWATNWGELFEGAKTTSEQIRDLEKKLKDLPGSALATNTQLTYTWPEKFQEFDLGRKRCVVTAEDVEQEVARMLSR